MFAQEVTEKGICGGACAGYAVYPDENALFENKGLLDRADRLVEMARAAVINGSEAVKRHVEIFALGMEYLRLYEKKDASPDEGEIDRFMRKITLMGSKSIRAFSTMDLFENQPQRVGLLGLKPFRKSMPPPYVGEI